MSRHWYDANLNPKFSFRWAGRTKTFITDGRGRLFQFHGGTKHDQIVSLVEYLDLLETTILDLGGKLPERKI